MATPTPGRPGPGQTVATPPVSTPFSNQAPAFSPRGPRSVVPSPAQHFKKSPANSNTIYGYPSGSGGGHPTNSSFGAGYDSPSAQAALGGMPSMAELGAQSMGSLVHLGRGDEDEKKRRLQQVLDILKTNKGRLSEPGLERIARHYGLAPMIDVYYRQRKLVIAGRALAIEVQLPLGVVQKVVVSPDASPEIASKHFQKAGDILSRDLSLAPGESPLTKMLDRFASNLERLAALDRLSTIPGFNCHEAIAGIYESLEKLHTWEVSRIREKDAMAMRDDEYLRRAVLCKKSGEPTMHARDRLGLSLDYWQDKSRMEPKPKSPKIWSLLIECAPLALSLDPSNTYTSARVSEQWISSGIQKADPAAEDITDDIMMAIHGGPVLDWLEPENTLLPSDETSGGMDSIGQPSQKLPDVMFVAKFDPPLIVPYNFAVQIGAIMDNYYQMTTFDGLMFPARPDEKNDSGETRQFTQLKKVPVLCGDESQEKIHKNTLLIQKIDYGCNLKELPFPHPRKLVELLPQFRQYALISTLLRKSFDFEPTPSQETVLAAKQTPKLRETSKRDAFADFMAQVPGRGQGELKVDITFTTLPSPHIGVVFPFKNRRGNVVFDIKLNGEVAVAYQNVLDPEVKSDRSLTESDLGRMLELTEDIGVWVEFVRRRLG